MNIIAFAVVLSVVQALPPVPRKTPDNSARRSHGVKKDSANKQRPGPGTALPLQESVKSQTKQNGSQAPSNADGQKSIVIREPITVAARKDPWDKWYVIFTGLLVLVGTAGVVMAYVTLRAIKAQSAIAKQSADAAKASAEATTKNVEMVMRIERPWVLAFMEWKVDQGILFNDQIRWASCTIKHFGKTAAWVESWTAGRENVNNPSDLPEEPHYGNVNDWVIPQVLPPGEGFTRTVAWTPEQFVAANDDKLFLFVLGFASYRDSFGESHDTRFCFRYYPPFKENRMQGWHVGGPPAYNRQT